MRRGLLKVRAAPRPGVGRLLTGQRGRISAREVYDQMNACSCLTLILACIVYWQAREISWLAAAPDFPFDPDLLRHVSPIEWKNVILYGEIKIDPAKLTRRGPYDSDRYKVANCTQPQPVFYCFPRLARGKAIAVTVLSVPRRDCTAGSLARRPAGRRRRGPGRTLEAEGVKPCRPAADRSSRR